MEEFGIHDYFVVPGDTNLTLLDNLVENPRLRMVQCCNELNTGYAADGYARTSEVKAAAVVIPYIVGGLSILNAISGACSERLKVIVLSGCPPTSILNGGKVTHHTPSPSNKDQALHAFQGVTAASVRVDTAESATDVIDDAITKCIQQSLPVYIELPNDIAGAPCPFPIPLTPKVEEATQTHKDGEALEAVTNLWNSSHRPVLLLGSQAQVSLSRDTIQYLAEKLGCPVLCQPDGRWISEPHPQYWGAFWPGLLNPEGEKLVLSSDLWLALGVSWSDIHTPSIDAKKESHRLISFQYGRVELPEGKVIAPISVSKLVSAMIDSTSIRPAESLPSSRPSHLASIQAEIKTSDDALTVRNLLSGIQSLVQEDSTLVADSGDAWFAASHIQLPAGVDLHMQIPYASIGWSVPATLGAQVARPYGRVVLMVGDGAFQMTAQEIGTMIRMKLNPIILLFNNLGYKTETAVHEGPYNYIANWDYTKLATSFLDKPHAQPSNPYATEHSELDAMPMFAEKIETQADLLRAIERVSTESDKLAFLECCIQPDDMTPELRTLGEKVSKGSTSTRHSSQSTQSHAISSATDLRAFLLVADMSDAQDSDREDLPSSYGRDYDTFVQETARIRKLYEAGVPFFTKEQLRDLSRQLKEAETSETREILITGLEGTQETFEVRTGVTRAGSEPGTEWVLKAPAIEYRTFGFLTSYRAYQMDGYSDLSLRVLHYMELRDEVTKELRPGFRYVVDSVQAIEESFTTCIQTWEASESYKQLQKIVESRENLPPITKIVALALGTMQPRSTENWDHRPEYQHALILTLHRIVSNCQGETADKIECFAQDPAYTVIDKSILERYDVTILDDPDAFVEIDDSTIVLTFAPDVPVRQIVADIARPAMMIWNTCEDEIWLHNGREQFMTDPFSPRLRNMMKAYDRVEFLSDEERFGEVAIFIRRN
ncbi:pyruvate decarboxylase [Aspergillus bombycis]|uniref:Pyruvate decarboxylase n=1 Tax=Aspergillus bombycis TaxID=109264 RepID=A0A1F8AE02_9EURO|nr:pyruvate decarboxylase [Aspergillus bombycis]OGM49605.1 pyruvate decarboxylase [Aspergillus bombycis]